MRRICQRHKFPKRADLFTSAHKYLCSLFFNFLAAGCSNPALIPLPLTSLSKIPPKTTKVLPWLDFPKEPKHSGFVWTCRSSPKRQHVDQVQSGFYCLYLSDFTACHLIYGCASALSPVSQHKESQELQEGPGFQQCWGDQTRMQDHQPCPISTLST